MDCELISATKTENYSRLARITLPGVKGRLQIYPGHAEAFILLKAGEVVLISGSQQAGANQQSEPNRQKKTRLDAKAVCYVRQNKVMIIL